jgi:hypothetical protein
MLERQQSGRHHDCSIVIGKGSSIGSSAVSGLCVSYSQSQNSENAGNHVIMSSSKVELKRLCYLYRPMPVELVVLNAQTPSMHDY